MHIIKFKVKTTATKLDRSNVSEPDGTVTLDDFVIYMITDINDL